MHPVYPVRLTDHELATAARQILETGNPLPTMWQRELVERLLKLIEPKKK